MWSTHLECRWSEAPPTDRQADTWWRGLVSARIPPHSSTATCCWSHNVAAFFQKSERGERGGVRRRTLFEYVIFVRSPKKKKKKEWKGGELTDALLAGVWQVVVARHIAPAAAIVPHHHRTVLARQEVAVGLPFVPVLVELTEEQKTLEYQ